VTQRNIEKDDKTSPGKKKPSTPDSLIKGDKAGKPELSEDELKNVTGGSFSWGVKID